MSRDTNFYYSFLVLPPSKRRAVIAVWDFCRAVDDAVDLKMTQSEADTAQCAIELDGWRRELARCFDDHSPQTVQGVQLASKLRQMGYLVRPQLSLSFLFSQFFTCS